MSKGLHGTVILVSAGFDISLGRMSTKLGRKQEPVVSTKDRKRPAPTSQRRGRGVTAKRGRGSSSVARTGFIDDDDVEDDDNDVVPAKSSGTPTSQVIHVLAVSDLVMLGVAYVFVL